MTTFLSHLMAAATGTAGSVGTITPAKPMSPDDYLMLSYVLGLALLAGYAVNLWLVSRWLRKRERRAD